jgi:phi13 family phage major tail protein
MSDLVLGATGKICTGFSYPYVAKYACNGGTITYTGAQELARGVKVDPSIDSTSSNKFQANNQDAEAAPSKFKSGTLKLTVDGLIVDSERFIMGLPTVDTDGWTSYGDSQAVPYVAVGYIARFMSGGVESFAPTVFPKTMFDQVTVSAESQKEEIDWQTQDLTANIYRSENSNHDWKIVGKDYATEPEALAALKLKLGVIAG